MKDEKATDASKLWDDAVGAGPSSMRSELKNKTVFKQTLDFSKDIKDIIDKDNSYIFTPIIKREYVIGDKLFEFTLNNLTEKKNEFFKRPPRTERETGREANSVCKLLPGEIKIDKAGDMNLSTPVPAIIIDKDSKLGPKFGKITEPIWKEVDSNHLVAAPTGTFTQAYEPPIVIHEDKDGNITSILKSQPDGSMRFYSLSSIEGDEKIFIPELEGEKGEIRIISKSDGTRLLKTIDRYGNEISITIEPDKAYLEEDNLPVPLYFETSTNEDGTKTYILDLNTRIPTFERITLRQAKSMVEKVKEMLLDKMAGISGLVNVTSAVKASVLTIEGINKVITWLGRMGIYVINCAIKALDKLLKSAGIYVDVEDLAARAIIYDLLTGIITPESSEILATSFSALQEVSKESGLELKRFLTTEEGLKNISSPVIAHLGGDHAVLVLGATDTEVTIVESDGKTYNVPLETFKSEWQGVILAERAPPLKRPYVPSLSELPPSEPLSLYKPPIEPEKIPLSPEITPETPGLPEYYKEELIAGGLGTAYAEAGEFTETTFRLLGEGDKLFDIITGFSLDGSINYSESWI